MPHYRPRSELETHDVANQPPPFEDVNLFEADRALKENVEKRGAGSHAERLSAYGAALGSAEMVENARLANQNPPKLVSFDRYGHRLDEVEFHPAYHALMDLGLSAGYSSIAWTAKKGGHVAHAAMAYLQAGGEPGVGCPMTMTYAAVPALQRQPEVAAEWIPRITAGAYDPRFIPAADKKAATMGMAMTEKQGGSDIRANTTVAEHVVDDEYELTGHKWFCSAPMCDAFLTLARTEAGITCFLVPRWRPDGTRNAFHIMRLKDKLGDRANASSEIEYARAWAQRVGEEGRGVRTIIEMVQHTRLDCIAGSAGGMRASVAQALWHAAHRSAFQKKLIDQPAMAMVLADLALETEAAAALAMRIAYSFDRMNDEREAAFMRLATPIAKYWVCKRQPGVVYEALECHGGAGFVEEGPMPRLFRQSPLNAIWEGSGNVIALDILRALAREPDSLESVRAEITAAAGANAHLDRHLAALDGWTKPGALNEGTARAFAEDMALALSAAALKQTAPDYVFDGFCNARLDPENRSYAYGAVTAKIDATAIIERARPV
ncbi:acyl-CoA dehydrogenase family protein [Hyphococcus luteus]|uniref:DNA alkylation response protein n=1 Tax=Hyphococcus luteus TaxID=2058213 RepID=A0A2S7K0R8_9PROT|nr:acyl-CoA dehydrogenase family protein [Marinicaulis flavus]PQA86094.1 DNA alkylation response protein [Marinicaulis flavus]